MRVTALPGPLVSPEWLADRLDGPGIRVFDCTVEIVRPDGGSEWAFDTEGPRRRWTTGHVPGASFADLVEFTCGAFSVNSINKTLTRLSQVMATAAEYELIAANPAAGRRRRLKGPRPNRPSARSTSPPLSAKSSPL